MREAKASYARDGELELCLDALPPAPPPPEPPPAIETVEDDERRNLEDLLYSSGVDPVIFERHLKRVV